MKFLSVTTEDACDVPLIATFVRKEIRIFGWHCATFYTHQLKYEPEDNWIVNYWFYIGPKDLGFGIHIPVRWKNK